MLFKKVNRGVPVGQKGFTLIELLVVIAIIGILSSVVLVSLQSSRAKARDAKRIADIEALKTALALYADSNSSHYPDSLDGLTNSLVSAKLLPPGPVRGPNNDEVYSYVTSGDKLSYHLGATLEQPNPNSFSNDRDCHTSTGSSATPASSICKGFPVNDSGVSGGFEGGDVHTVGGNNVGCDGVTFGKCYDVAP